MQRYASPSLRRQAIRLIRTEITDLVMRTHDTDLPPVRLAEIREDIRAAEKRARYIESLGK